MPVVNDTAPALFGDNCAVCHGVGADRGARLPEPRRRRLALGRRATEAILETLRVGINSAHPETRFAQMLAFGRDGMLSRDEIRHRRRLRAVALRRRARRPSGSPRGAEIFAENCASCHGEDGRGSIELGAPNLTDAFWIYGGDDASMFETIYDGRQGWMPAWEDRLSLADRKILTVYLQELAKEGSQ